MHPNKSKKWGPQDEGVRTSLASLEKPIQKIWAGYISTMSQGFNITSKYNTNNFHSLSNISK